MLSKDFEKMSPQTLGLLQAVGVTLYCSLVGLLMWKGNVIFGKADQYFGPVTFLLLFVVSAMITALMVFYKPYVLFFGGKKKEAIDVVLSTTSWLVIFFFVFLFIIFVR